MDANERFRQAVAALQAYCENRKNPLDGPKMSELVDKMFAARDALVDEQKKRAK